MNDHMKPSTLFLVLLALVGLALTALAADYGSLINQGYRWVTVNGPHAYPSKEDAQNGGAGRKSESKQPVVHAYYLIPGMVVLVVDNDSSTGLSRICAGRNKRRTWTATKNLSTQPIETPGTANIMSFASPKPTPDSNASHRQQRNSQPSHESFEVGCSLVIGDWQEGALGWQLRGSKTGTVTATR